MNYENVCPAMPVALTYNHHNSISVCNICTKNVFLPNFSDFLILVDFQKMSIPEQ